jgi:hypothetical protein
MIGKFTDLIGQKFGYLLVVGRAPNHNRRSAWICICRCGKRVIKGVSEVKLGHSCGCWNRECRLRHGHTGSNRRCSPTYVSWRGMRARCLNPNSVHWKDYGGRGIKVCERWNSFENFLEDMGERPEGMTLDRINNDGDYEPSNCKWSTQSEQVKNQRKRKLLEKFSDEEIIGEYNRRFKK